MKSEDKILESAAKLMYERGFASVRMDEIGAGAGMTGPAIYRHFESKDAILATLFELAMDRFVEMLPAPSEDTEAELRAMIEGHLKLVLTQLEWASVAVREGRTLKSEFRRRIAYRERQYTARWIDAIRRRYPGLDDVEYGIAAYSLLGLLNSAVNWPAGATTVDSAATLVTGMALQSLEHLAEAAVDSGELKLADA